jgi:hypothetical protein
MIKPGITRVGGLAFGASAALLILCYQATAQEQDAVRQFDPRSGEFLKVDPADVSAGEIYNHYSSRHERYVWAYALEDGSFSYPLGPGTTESPRNFALAMSDAEMEQLLRSAGNTVGRSWVENQEIRVRLGVDDKWSVLATAGSNRSHFDLNSGRRWEWHGSRRMPVSHINGYTWRYDSGRYVAANPWLASVLPASCSCMP